MDIINNIINKAKKRKGIIILPEANIDKRVYSACKTILKQGLAKIVVFGKAEEFDKTFFNPNCTIIDIKKYPNLKQFANQLFDLRKHKGLTEEESKKLVTQPEYFACMLLHNGLADGMVAGANWTTANTLRPALQIIKTKPNKKLVTGAMLMIKEGAKPLVFADISLNVNPSAEELAEIAISSAKFYKDTLNKIPFTAFLSYSTNGSAKSEMVNKIKQATILAKNDKYQIDGEMQADAAINAAVAKQKFKTSPVAGRANVLVFPDLNSGNIAYKLVSRLAGYTAIGPIMLNFNKPVNDLSRGCTANEIVLTTCITKLQI